MVTVVEKFAEGGWLTLLITSGLVALCFLIKRHYGLVVRAIKRLDHELPGPEEPHGAGLYDGAPGDLAAEPDASKPVAIVFVGGYGGLGRHAMLTLLRMFPDHFKGVVFVSIAVVDSDSFKGVEEVAALEKRTQDNLAAYQRFATALGLASTTAYAVGTEVAVEAEGLARQLMKRYPKGLVVAGQIIFEEDTAWNRLLHNETAFLIQRRLQHDGIPMVVLPVQLDLEATRQERPPVSRLGRRAAAGGPAGGAPRPPRREPREPRPQRLSSAARRPGCAGRSPDTRGTSRAGGVRPFGRVGRPRSLDVFLMGRAHALRPCFSRVA